MINETLGISQEQFMNIHNTSTIPSLVLLYIVSIFSFLFIGLNLVKKSRGKFMMIWIWSSIVTALFLAFLIGFPNTVQSILNYFSGVLR